MHILKTMLNIYQYLSFKLPRFYHTSNDAKDVNTDRKKGLKGDITTLLGIYYKEARSLTSYSCFKFNYTVAIGTLKT